MEEGEDKGTGIEDMRRRRYLWGRSKMGRGDRWRRKHTP